jgi:hypothetical protein
MARIGVKIAAVLFCSVVLPFQFRVEKSQEKQYQHAEEDECPEGQIPEDPHCAPGYQVGVGIKKPDAPGNQEYQAE